MKTVDVAVVGGGPAGLATAIEAAHRGLEVVVLERQKGVLDKACGEGLMPSGVRALERLGARRHLDPAACAPFTGIRYVQEDGTRALGHFRGGAGLGIRRTALSTALERAAQETGVKVERGVAARELTVRAEGVTLETDGGSVEARALVAADGLHSPLRRKLGLELPPRPLRRFGLRRHFRGVTPAEVVEVHWTPGVECYVTPVGPDRVGVAFLLDASDESRPDFDALLARFPAVAARLMGAEPDSELRGAGPLAQPVRGVASGRVALVGDAAGYVDAITGEGLTLAFASAARLAELLPAVVAGRGGPEPLAPYARFHARLFRKYALAAGSLVWLAQRPRLRRRIVRTLARFPGLFDLALRWTA